MKLKTVYSTIALIFVVVGLALWKLNETYRIEKLSVKQNQLQTQLTSLRSALVSQLSQLRNTLSTYTVQIDESKINWVQLKPFYALALVQEDALNALTVTKLFVQSGSVAERWNPSTLQDYLKAKVSGNQLLRAQTFKDGSGLPHLALAVFDREKRNNIPRSGVLVVGDISYFQRFFDLQRTSSITQVLLTADKQVAAHSEYEYVGNNSDENKISELNFFVDRQEMRGTNLTLLSYSSKNAQSYLHTPLSVLGTILGLAFLMSGVLLFAVKPEKQVTDESYPRAKSSSADAARVQKTAPVKNLESEDESTGLGFTLSAPTSQPLTREVPVKVEKPKFVPLLLDQEEQVVSIQVQASLQQALFNVDRQLKAHGVTISKEFVSSEMIDLDYPKFIKIFENILLTVAQNISGNKKRIQLRSYDSEKLTSVEIQAPLASFNLHEAIPPVLKQGHCEFTQLASSAGEAILKFTFARPEEKLEKPSISVTPPALPVASSEPRFELSEEDVEDFKMPEKKLALKPKPSVIQDDLDIDALLSLDDEPASQQVTETKKSKISIEKEMQPSKFKLDDKMSIVEDPVINVDTQESKKVDKAKVKIRRPEKG